MEQPNAQRQHTDSNDNVFIYKGERLVEGRQQGTREPQRGGGTGGTGGLGLRHVSGARGMGGTELGVWCCGGAGGLKWKQGRKGRQALEGRLPHPRMEAWLPYPLLERAEADRLTPCSEERGGLATLLMVRAKGGPLDQGGTWRRTGREGVERKKKQHVSTCRGDNEEQWQMDVQKGK